MLEQTRRQASIFVYIIFGLLIVIFVYGINPGNRGGREDGGCGTSSNTVVTVDGNDASHSAFLVAYSSNQGQGRQRTYIALDQVIYRELLAQAAADRGIRATGDLIDDEIKSGHGYFYLGGQRIDVSHQFFEDGLYRHKRWIEWVASRNLQSPGAYREEQARGLQATLMADLISSSVRVSRDEALSNYLYENNTVTYDVVAFDPASYRRAMRLTDADIKRYLDGHAAEVEARYKADERTYKGVKPQIALREIFIPKAEPEASKAEDKAAKPDDKAAKTARADDKPAKAARADDKPAKTAKADDKPAKTAKADDKPARADDKAAKTAKAAKADDKAAKPDDKAARADDKAAKTAKADDKAKAAKPAAGDDPKPVGLPVDVAKAKLEAVRTQIAAGKLTFAEAEKQLAADAGDAAPTENGDRGWQSVDKPGLGDKAINDAVKTLKPGEMTPVIVTDRGAYLVTATGKREGDLGFDQVKTEIAAALARDTWSKEAAKREALDTLAKAQAGTGKNLDQMFEREPVKPSGGGIEQLLQDPSIPQEEKQKILEQLLQQQQQKHGSLELHEKDVPVAWYADADGSAKAAPAAGSAPAPAAGSAPAANSTAPATGSTTPAAGSTPPAANSTAPATGSTAPAAGSTTPAAGSTAPATGSAAPAAGSAASAPAGSAAPPAAGSPAAPATPAPEITASRDVLPQFGDVSRPRVARFGPSPREPKMAGVGGSKEAISALFDELSPGNLAKKVYEGDGGSYIVVQLVSRSQPKVEDFDKTADAEIARMQEARGKAALHGWLRSRCDALTKANRIRPAADKIRETDDKGNPAPTVYRPCMYLDYLDR